MSCARRRANVETASSPVLSHSVEQSINHGLNRLLQLHEQFMETQRLEMHNHAQALTADYVNLRMLLESQHQEVLLKISSDQQKNTQQDIRHENLIVAPSEFANGPLPNWLDFSTTEPPEMLRKKLIGGLSTTDMGDELDVQPVQRLDVQKLPVHWATNSQAQEDLDATAGNIVAKIRMFVRSSKFDMIMSVLLLINFATMCIEMEWRSYQVALLMGKRDDDNGWAEAEGFFRVLEVMYSVAYAIELFLHCYASGRKYLLVPINVLDAAIVVFTFTSTCVLRPLGLGEDTSKFAVARIMRLCRLIRFFRVGTIAHAFTELRILARALACSLSSLISAFVLLAGVIISGAILLFQSLAGYVEDDSNPIEQREWVYENFGSLTLAIIAMFEATFTGSWHRYTRQLILHINGYLAIFWIIYIVGINFAVMRLIGALFLKQTLQIALNDAEKMSMSQLQHKQKFAQVLREVFAEGDTSGDGKISVDEFQRMVYDPHIGHCFENLDLEVAEVATLFQLLSVDDREADYEEFLEGALKLKNSARTIDVIQLLHSHQTEQKQIETLYEVVSNTFSLVSRSVNQKGASLHGA